MRYITILLSLTIFVLLNGCSLQKQLVISSAQIIVEGGLQSILEENDVQLARTGMESELKLLEGLILTDPDNRELLTLAARGFAGYSLLFLEDSSPERSVNLYSRAVDYGFRALSCSKHIDNLRNDIPLRSFTEKISKLGREEAEAAYWTAVAWSGIINIKIQTSYNVLVDIPRVNLLMKQVMQIDSLYYYSGPLLYFGAYYASVPAMAGGNIELSRQYFEQADSNNNGQFLFGKLLYAKYVAVQTLDRELFIKLLNEIVTHTDENTNRDLILINSVTKLKAAELLKDVDSYF